MGLYTILKKHRLKDRQLRFLFLGLDAAGKSTIVGRLLSPTASPDQQSLKDISPTFGFKITTVEFENYKLNICISQSMCLIQGMWEAKKLFEHIGEITLNKPTASSG
jgi:ADP-ribosylation factor-like protein 2